MSIMVPERECFSEAGEAENSLKSGLRERGVKVFEFNPLEDPRWKALTEIHPTATVFHSVEWLRALKACYGYEPRALTLTPPELPLTTGFVYCQIRSALTGNRLVSLPFSDHCEPLVDGTDDFNSLLGNLSEAVDQKRWKYLETRPVMLKPASARNFGTSDTYFLHRLNLLPSEEALFKNFHKGSVQRKIRRAEREKLRYEAGSSEKMLDQFYDLLVITRRRLGLPPQPRKWFESLIACMGPSLKIRIALKGETPVASILTLAGKKSVVYKYGCSEPRFNNLGGTALLFWNTICEAKASGCDSFDLGRSDIHNPGLVTFKERWGAERIAVNYWRYPAPAARSEPEAAIRRFRRIVRLAPRKLLVTLGNLFYRHVG
jgi:CelD/BcsL family acetyltransferase involved in cellulose biosynthesis